MSINNYTIKFLCVNIIIVVWSERVADKMDLQNDKLSDKKRKIKNQKINLTQCKKKYLNTKNIKSDKVQVSVDDKLGLNKTDISFKTKEVVFIALITCIISLFFGTICAKELFDIDYDNSITDNDKIQEIVETYNSILNDYDGQIDEDDLVNGAVKGMLEATGDQHTTFIDEEENSTFNATLDGNYQGLGVEIVGLNDGNILITRVFEESPADKAGIKSGDIITGIDDKLSSEMTTSEFSAYVKSKDGNVTIYVERNDEQLSFDVSTSNVTIKSVYSEDYQIDGKLIGYISVSIFASNTYEQFKEELEKLEQKKIDSLIIDLRDNSGGHLEIVKKMISLFLDSSHVIYQTETDGEIEKFYSTGGTTKNYKIILLSNGNSASASEIMMGALSEEYGATIVGEKSYGKGSVQELRTLSSGAQYKITIKKWLTPKGNCIDGVGIIPDYEVKISEAYYTNPVLENDDQLNKALELAK